MFEKLSKQRKLNEQDTSLLMKKLFSAVYYMHLKGIVHRDLKLENILYETKDPDSEIKIIDFGLSLKHKLKQESIASHSGNGPKNLKQTTMVGTPYYMAPEIFSGNYDERCDMWSLGVIMHLLLTGQPPFYSDEKLKLFEMIRTEQLDFQQKHLKDLSKEAKALLAKLLEKNPKKRISAEEALKSNWFKV